MKKIFLLLLMAVVSVAAFSQAPAGDSATAKKQKKNPAAWACPSCFKITKEGGNCEQDKSAKVQLGTYYCQHCMKATGTQPGQCAMCKGTTTQMTRKLCAQHRNAKRIA